MAKIQIPERFPATFTDAAQYSQTGWAVLQIHLIIEFDGLVSKERLEKAIRLSLDAEPILSCRLVPRFFLAYWQRLSDRELADADLLEMVEDEGRDGETAAKFLAMPLDVCQGPQVKCLLIHEHGSDCLIAKVNHFAPDAAGVKDWVRVLADIYRGLDNDPGFSIEPNLCSRDLDLVYRHIKLSSLLKMMPGFLVMMLRSISIRKPVRLLVGVKQEGPCSIVVRKIPESRVKKLRQYLQEKRATLNDYMVSSLFRVLASYQEGKSRRLYKLSQTLDLRQYIPGGRVPVVCHLSSGFYPDIGRNVGDTPEETLEMVKKDIDALKKNNYALCLMWCLWKFFAYMPFGVKTAFMRIMWHVMIRTGYMPTVFTNMGAINAGELDFGHPGIWHAELTIPPVMPPFFGLGMSGFRNTLTLSAGIWESAVPREKIEDFFDRIEAELP